MMNIKFKQNLVEKPDLLVEIYYFNNTCAIKKLLSLFFRKGSIAFAPYIYNTRDFLIINIYQLC